MVVVATMRHLCLVQLSVIAIAVCLIVATSAFSFTQQQPSKQGYYISTTELPMQRIDDEPSSISSRRDFFSRVAAATAPILLTTAKPSSASATTNEPTRIELSVDTEYLIRVLEYFDGDMRKVLGVLVRAPSTTVEIDPPPAKRGDKNPSPKDAILRALYSYNAPDDYATQSSWLKLDEPSEGWIELLTKKRYRVYLPSISSGDDGKENGRSVYLPDEDREVWINEKGLEVSIRPTNLKLSNLEAGVAAAVASYPLAFGYYNYESYREEEQKKLKKAQMAAKKAAKAKAAAAKKAKKGTPVKKESVSKGKEKEGKKGPPAMKGQESKKDVTEKKSPPKKKRVETAEEKAAAEMLDSSRVAATKQAAVKDATNAAAAEMLDSQRKAATEQAKLKAKEADQTENAAAAAESAEPPQSAQTAPGGGYLDNLSVQSSPNTGSNLRSLVENAKPQRGSGSNSYLDSL